jgi:hypothetical protein
MTSSICFSDWKYVGTVYFVDIIDDFYYTEILFTIMLDAINTYLSLNFVPDFYEPEAGISGNSLEMDHRG